MISSNFVIVQVEINEGAKRVFWMRAKPPPNQRNIASNLIVLHSRPFLDCSNVNHSYARANWLLLSGDGCPLDHERLHCLSDLAGIMGIVADGRCKKR